MEEKRCTRCVMTNKGDNYISFDANGVCNYCKDAFNRMNALYFPNEEGESKLNSLIREIKTKNQNKPYDCIMGISGGLDSSYLAYLGAAKWGLRIKAIHVDDGYDTEISKKNIKRLVDKCGIDLEVISPDSKQFNELTRAYMMAGVPNLAIPQDNILMASIYSFIKEKGVSDFLSGGNFSLECILQRGNTWPSTDIKNIMDISKRFGREKTDKLKFISEWDKRLTWKKNTVREHRPLNFIEYNREKALAELADFCGFEYYGSKHLENYLTGFLQLYWLPHKFNVDKRTSHLSSMIVSGQMSREDAIKALEGPAVSDDWINKAIGMIKERMDLSEEEFDAIMNSTPHQHNEYKTDKLLEIAAKFYKYSQKRNS